MKIKTAKCKYIIWYVDFNTKELKPYNVLHQERIDYIAKWVKRGAIDSYKELKNWLVNDFNYYYRGKCEWEFLIYEWPPSKDCIEKVNGWDQIKENIDLIVAEVNRKMELGFKEE